MRTKSAYRKYRDGGAVVPEDVAPASTTAPADVATVESDDASSAFKTQIEHLLRAEEAAKQRAEIPSPPPPSDRSRRLAQLRREGLSEATVSFLARNPNVMDHPQLADQAARAARDEGHQPDTPGFFEAVKSNFEKITAPAEEDRPFSSALETASKYSGGSSTPAIAEEAAFERSQSSRRAGLVSAPVSREVPTSIREDRGSTVTLTPAMREAARISGLSDVEYARNVLLLRQAKRDDPGRYGGG